MQKCIVSLCCLTILFSFIVSMVFSQEDMETIDNLVFDKPVRTPSIFVHDIHNQNAGLEDCSTCHHKYVDGELVENESSEDQRCYECHSPNASEDRLSLRKAFHQCCKGCHMKQKKGPILCGECHRK